MNNNLKEDIFHYAWLTKKFKLQDLRTTLGETIEVKKFGHHNTNAGPDFLNAEVIVAGQRWVGNIEIHTKSSDWYNHRHQFDNNYDSVILHVSYIHDREIRNSKKQLIPTLELKDIIDPKLFTQYERFKSNSVFIPCEKLISGVDPSIVELYKEQLIVERFKSKTSVVDRMLNDTRHDWNETAYRFLFRSIGGNINQEAYETLAIKSPWKIIMKNIDQEDYIHALLFGQAGFLEGEGDYYFSVLKESYDFLASKYDLNPMPLSSWKFSRMRPVNFPTMRIAYFADLLAKHPELLSLYLWDGGLADLKNILRVTLHSYWCNHYVFNKKSKKSSSKKSSDQFIDRLLINAILPFRFYYGKINGDERMSVSSLEMMRLLKAEKNKLMTSWQELEVGIVNALDSQAMLHLYKNNCNLNNCLKCSIGHSILSKT